MSMTSTDPKEDEPFDLEREPLLIVPGNLFNECSLIAD